MEVFYSRWGWRAIFALGNGLEEMNFPRALLPREGQSMPMRWASLEWKRSRDEGLADFEWQPGAHL